MLLYLPNPCSENWAEMTPELRGRFCQNCQKTVIDFSEMSDSQVISFFDANKENAICGHFKASQISRHLAQNTEIYRPNRHPTWKYMIWSALAMGAFTACQSNEIAAEKNLPQVSCTQTLGKSTWKDDEKDPDFIHLSGLLIAPETEKGMIISVKGTNISIKPNLTNNFEVYLDSSWKHKEIELIISSTHYKEIRYIVQQGDFQGMIRIEVETGKVDAPSKRFHMVGEVVPKLK